MKRIIAISLLLLAGPLTAFAQQPAANARGQFSASGTVVNAVNGEAVRKAQVQLSPVGQAGQTQHFETGSDGVFVFHGLTPGKYNLIVQAHGFPQQLLDQHGAFNTGVAVGSDKVSSGIVFRLRPEAAISGRILDEHNELVREAQVLLFMRGNDMGKKAVERRGQARSDDQGQYHFNHLQPGTYYVAVSAQPWYSRYGPQRIRSNGTNQAQVEVDPALDVAYPVTYYPGATDSEEAGAIMLRAGDRISADFNLVPVQSLHITIPNVGQERNGVMPNFRERVFGDANIFVQPQVSWSQDHVEVYGIAPGTYSLILNRGGGPDRNQQVQEVSLQGNAEVDLSQLQTLESVHGTLKLDGAQPSRNPVISLQNSTSGMIVPTGVNEDGTFTVQPPNPGRYAVSLGNAPGYAIRTISATGTHISGRSFDFTGTQPVELTIQASEGTGIVNGIVKNGDRPISGAMVVLVPDNPADNLSIFRRDQSDSDGTFTLRDVVPGHYTALALQNGWEMEWGSPETLRPYLGKGTPVDIAGKQQLDIKVAAQ